MSCKRLLQFAALLLACASVAAAWKPGHGPVGAPHGGPIGGPIGNGPFGAAGSSGMAYNPEDRAKQRAEEQEAAEPQGIYDEMRRSPPFMHMQPPTDAEILLLEPYRAQWNDWKSKHGVTFSSTNEERIRMKLMVDNQLKVKVYNDKPNAKFKLAINHLSALSPDELKLVFGSNSTRAQWNPSTTFVQDKNDTISLFATRKSQGVKLQAPTALDWRASGVVSYVKNQGTCGSCYAFATSAAVESALAISKGTLADLSMQQIVSCLTINNQVSGCNGGDVSRAMDYVKTNGLMYASDLPYSGTTGTCPKTLSSITKISSFVELTKCTVAGCAYPSESKLITAVAITPVTVAIQATNAVFTQYSSGIIDSTDCGNSVDHAVLVVGYGSEDGTDYWIVKNSWGPKWGENGYVRIARGLGVSRGICGIQTDPIYPTGAWCTTSDTCAEYATQAYSLSANGTCVYDSAGVYGTSSCGAVKGAAVGLFDAARVLAVMVACAMMALLGVAHAY